MMYMHVVSGVFVQGGEAGHVSDHPVPLAGSPRALPCVGSSGFGLGCASGRSCVRPLHQAPAHPIRPVCFSVDRPSTAQSRESPSRVSVAESNCNSMNVPRYFTHHCSCSAAGCAMHAKTFPDDLWYLSGRPCRAKRGSPAHDDLFICIG